MNEVINRMYEKREQPYEVSIAQHFHTYSQYYNTIIIVEGVSDENFYEKTNIKLLNNACYIYANQQANIVGKKAVIDAYFRIREWARNKPYNNSIIFIVDKDFFGINWKAPAYNDFEKKYGAKNEDINNFTILDCHSHECYFILENNLKQIFKLLNIEDKLEEFNKILEDNLENFSEYFAYKCILEDENPKYPRYLRDWENIKGINFNFEYKENKLVFNIEDMQNGIKKMKKEIQFSENRKNLENQYIEMKAKFKKHPELLRGHTLYELLECYLSHYKKSIKDFQEYNDKVIKEMDIPLNIKVLKFGFGGYKLEKDASV